MSTTPHSQDVGRSNLAPPPVARLALADGSVYAGPAFGATGRSILSRAEVVFNTAVSGYQESLTDPSYAGQILVQTFPLIGNTGTNPEDVESSNVQIAGLVVRELARRHSNFRADSDLSAYLARHNVLGIAGVDTRAITRKLRTTGSIPGVLTDRADLTADQLVEAARSAPSMAGQNLVPLVGCASRSSWTKDLGEWKPAAAPSHPAGKPRFRVAALDCGAKSNILRNLTERGCEVVLVPHDTPAATLRDQFASGQIHGVFISNGPGDPAAVEKTIATLRVLMDPKQPPIPMFGICLGHQLLALAAGAQTYKLKFGHRGINHPILNTDSGRVEITSQNHGFAVEPKSLEAAGGVLTHRHLNDGTVAGFRMKNRPVFSVQYHPEASPGPHDAGYLFDQFVAAMSEK
jgi:carbamoyl-phosphate synthase small subunit